jgi:hypothetical protein
MVNTDLTPLAGWLCRAQEFIRRFVVLSDDQALAVVLWAAHTHAFDAAYATPYLSITSAEMGSGKTRLLEVLRFVVANPWFTGRTTTAALTRKIDKAHPTLLLDEGDPAFNGDREYAEALRGVLNSGYRRGGATTICVGQGATLDTRDFSTFCPKAIAGIGRLPDTVESRSIGIRLKKRRSDEHVERLRERQVRSIGEALSAGLDMKLQPHVDALAQATPELPGELSDRAQDVWEPLLAIADLAGGLWPRRAREAAVALMSGGSQETTLGVRLLSDVREVFVDDQRATTAELLDRLNTLDEAPWGAWNDGSGMKPRELANKLRPFEVSSRDIRTKSGTRKGYSRDDLEDAWARYLPSADAKRDMGDIGLPERKAEAEQARRDPPSSRTATAQKPLVHADVADVAASGTDPRDNGYHQLTVDEYAERYRKRVA